IDQPDKPTKSKTSEDHSTDEPLAKKQKLMMPIEQSSCQLECSLTPSSIHNAKQNIEQESANLFDTYQIDHRSTSKGLQEEGASNFQGAQSSDSTSKQFLQTSFETTDQESAKLCETYQIDHQVP